MENYKKITKIGNSEIVFETGKIARQATGAVLVSSGNTQVLSTVVVGRPPGEHQDFFPLTVNYCLLYTSPSPRDLSTSRMPSSA